MKRIQNQMNIGNVTLSGRIIMPPVGTYKSDENKEWFWLRIPSCGCLWRIPISGKRAGE